ncbi:MAG: DNA recombination protein RmuC [Treponema sp.]|nr:DNA recombination protein RmuC [Treponema sp.]
MTLGYVVIVLLGFALAQILQIILLIVLLAKGRRGGNEEVLRKLGDYDRRLEKSEAGLREEFARSRDESGRGAREAREELSASLASFAGLIDNKMRAIQEFLDSGLKYNREELGRSAKESREELVASLKSFEEKSSAKTEALTRDMRESLERNRVSVERKLAEIQDGNEKKLEKMRETVDEKLQKTLEARLGESFKLVSERLELVQKGLGEMQNLASDVGDLKKVMSNVKTKGVLGEYQLGAILEQMLSPSQYEKNVKTKPSSNGHVEFAIKIPSREDSSKTVWLPIDAKLPTSGYETLVDAYDKGDKDAIDSARRAFARTVKGFAKDIREKYIDSPNTTDFGIMFLPFEGAYAEVVRDPELFEGIQREHQIIVTGPSTIAALLNALQIGFRSLAVEKGTGLILSTLSAVKKEFGSFEAILVKVKDQIDRASSTLDETVGKRAKAINRALKKVETTADVSPGRQLLAESALDFDDAE